MLGHNPGMDGMLANLAGIGAVVLIAVSLHELRTDHRPTLPLPLVGALLAAITAINAHAHPAILALDVVRPANG